MVWVGCPASFYNVTLPSGKKKNALSFQFLQQSSSVDCITKPLDRPGQVSEGRG